MHVPSQLSAREAADLIREGDVVGQLVVGLGCPDAVLAGIGQRYWELPRRRI